MEDNVVKILDTIGKEVCKEYNISLNDFKAFSITSQKVKPRKYYRKDIGQAKKLFCVVADMFFHGNSYIRMTAENLAEYFGVVPSAMMWHRNESYKKLGNDKYFRNLAKNITEKIRKL